MWLRLTIIGGDSLLVNMDHIADVAINDRGHTSLGFPPSADAEGATEFIEVEQTPQYIFDMLEGVRSNGHG